MYVFFLNLQQPKPSESRWFPVSSVRYERLLAHCWHITIASKRRQSCKFYFIFLPALFSCSFSAFVTGHFPTQMISGRSLEPSKTATRRALVSYQQAADAFLLIAVHSFIIAGLHCFFFFFFFWIAPILFDSLFIQLKRVKMGSFVVTDRSKWWWSKRGRQGQKWTAAGIVIDSEKWNRRWSPALERRDFCYTYGYASPKFSMNNASERTRDAQQSSYNSSHWGSAAKIEQQQEQEMQQQQQPQIVVFLS